MSTTVLISGTEFSIPSQGENPPWGDDLNSLLLNMVELLTTLSASTDIATTSFVIDNNVAAFTNIVGMSFNNATVRSGIISYSLYRATTLSELSEAGHLYVTYKSTLGSWEIAQTAVGNSDVLFTITNAGQVQYSSSNMLGANYVGKLTFNAKSFAN